MVKADTKNGLSSKQKARIGAGISVGVLIVVSVVIYMIIRFRRNRRKDSGEIDNIAEAKEEGTVTTEGESPYGGDSHIPSQGNNGTVPLNLPNDPTPPRFSWEISSNTTGGHVRSQSNAQPNSRATSPCQTNAPAESTPQSPPPGPSQTNSTADAQSHNQTSNVSGSTQPNPIADESLPEVYNPASKNPVEQYQELQRLRLERERARNRVSSIYRLQTLEQQLIAAQQDERSFEELIRQREQALATADQRRDSTPELPADPH